MTRLLYLLMYFAILAITAQSAQAQMLGNANCETLLLVSGYNSDNVKIYDGCDGTFIRNLDNTGTVAGPQAIIEAPNGDVLVVSEKNHRVVRFDRQTLTYDAVVVGDDPQTSEDESSGLLSPTAAAIGVDGNLYVGSFSQNRVQRFSLPTGESLGTFVPAQAGGIQGIDAGMVFDPNGNLAIPGFDSNSVLRVNGQTGAVLTTSIPAGSGGLNAPRTVVFSPDGQRMLVSSWRNGLILEYSVGSGAFIGQFGPGVNRITGMAYGLDDGPNNNLYTTSDQDNSVLRLNANTGAFVETFVPSGSGGLNGATFIFVLQKQNNTLADQTPQQFWLTGLGEIVENRIIVQTMRFTTSGAFGNDFDAEQIQRYIWGSLEIVFDSCNSAEMTYSADVEGSGLFADGGYRITRLLPNAPGDSCENQGFNNVVNGDWISGTWAGIPERSGEGFFLDAASENRVAVAWFTYMPVGFMFPDS